MWPARRDRIAKFTAATDRGRAGRAARGGARADGGGSGARAVSGAGAKSEIGEFGPTAGIADARAVKE